MQRVPETLVEIKCLSKTPSERLLGFQLHQVECTPMHWTVRVFNCDNASGKEDQQECAPSEERITMACVPTIVSDYNSNQPVNEEPTFVEIQAQPGN